ncbi:MAG TPA: class I SAM-dependent methyltransferase [Pirellulales bacterium]|jgi:SAM-dependent methyltransferase|nr:class I SAM-dependent methyltransferase [Pirellulales bacterium]
MGFTATLRYPSLPLRLVTDSFRAGYQRRLAGYLAPLLDGVGSALDVGCDDGSMASELMALRPGIEFRGVDIQTLRPARIPRAMYDGHTLPFHDGTFDAVIAIDVLHHTRHIPELLAEMARVSRRLVILKEHLVEGAWSTFLVGLGDVLSNAPYGIGCAFNYPTLAGWQASFDAAGLDLVELRQDLDLGPGCIRRYNPLFKLSKGGRGSLE